MRQNNSSKLSKIWDWPVNSEYASDVVNKKKLKLSAEFGAAVGGLISMFVIASFAGSTGAALLIAGVSVVGGYYAGSTAWKASKYLNAMKKRS
ncbi:hypothetical protein [Tateyamaria sp.]|uniref:hypothetical protein n=1 Tax=Tateyamaria sp. TaxID=1929288 RepID=UPI00329EC945